MALRTCRLLWNFKIMVRRPTHVVASSPFSANNTLNKHNNPITVKRKPRPEFPDSISSSYAVDIRDAQYSERVKQLMEVFTKGDIEEMANTCPEILLDSWKQVMDRVNYVLFKMGLDQTEMVDAAVFEYPLERIVQRHLFLERCGRFKKESMKKKELSLNPSLAKVVRTTDEHFIRLAGVSNEEYYVFLDMFQAEKQKLLHPLLEGDELVNEDDDDDLDDSEAEAEQEKEKSDRNSRYQF